mgnify:CR=1 FL=1
MGNKVGNLLERNFSKLPLLYETKHETFENNKKKVVVVVVVSGVVSSVGRLGETWVGWPDLYRPIFLGVVYSYD